MLPQLHRSAFAFTIAALALTSDGHAQESSDHNPNSKSATSQPAATTGLDRSRHNLQQLLTASLTYAKKKKGQIPASFQDIGTCLPQGGETLVSLLKNPQHPELAGNGYIYVPPPEKNIDRIIRSKDRLAIYEAGGFREGMNVGFWDGHIEWIEKRSQFDALLSATVPRSINPRQFDPQRPKTFGRVDQKASVEAQSFQIVRELTEAVVMHTEDNRSGAPNDLKNLGAYLLQPNRLTPASYLTNPRRPQYLDKGYIYIPPKAGRLRVDYHESADMGGLAQLPVVYEAGDIEDGIFIGFWDAHSEYVRDKAEIEKLLADAKAR